VRRLQLPGSGRGFLEPVVAPEELVAERDRGDAGDASGERLLGVPVLARGLTRGAALPRSGTERLTQTRNRKASKTSISSTSLASSDLDITTSARILPDPTSPHPTIATASPLKQVRPR
jgi:hypothetical protein